MSINLEDVDEANAVRYERYLNMDDNEAFDHIQNIGADAPNLDTFVQRLLLEQLDGKAYTQQYDLD